MNNEFPVEFPVERGIPLESDKQHRARKTWDRPKFPFHRMDIGDSFCVYPHEVGNLPLIKVQNLVSGAASNAARETRRKFTTRQINGRYVRAWRVA